MQTVDGASWSKRISRIRIYHELRRGSEHRREDADEKKCDKPGAKGMCQLSRSMTSVNETKRTAAGGCIDLMPDKGKNYRSIPNNSLIECLRVDDKAIVALRKRTILYLFILLGRSGNNHEVDSGPGLLSLSPISAGKVLRNARRCGRRRKRCGLFPVRRAGSWMSGPTVRGGRRVAFSNARESRGCRFPRGTSLALRGQSSRALLTFP